MSSSTDLCLTCSCSIRNHSPQSVPFNTSCCHRSICQSCLANNPRLRLYNPCLFCLGGVDAVKTPNFQPFSAVAETSENDVFILGDLEDEEPTSVQQEIVQGQIDIPRSHPDSTSIVPLLKASGPTTFSESAPSEPVGGETDAAARTESNTIALPNGLMSRYYIKPLDTLVGISLKFSIDGRKLTFIDIPYAGHPLPPPPPELLQQRERERAVKRLQLVTKESDLGVAQSYVALADLADPLEMKSKEQGTHHVTSKQNDAVAAYLEDEDWENSMRKQGVKPSIQRFRRAG
ncbi:hypothetical protein SISSUDRAFT_347202 [Sistotremastrum suecicum HHB10207 ss-3]|uniref:Uncharacterized protein n=1 Tax=Sistotremastrum suecicum HHB10207 ss-3 TaxID=1314776 RepID=A0A166G0R5_9AGAM|nr:hypothetical protein SISSUDRAFT_347202 [Sistotremastrum suecicum HHB10207 ss-3]